MGKSMTLRHLARLALVGAAVAVASLGNAWAQSGPIKFIVGLAPGGAVDPYARIVADAHVEGAWPDHRRRNRPGATGNTSAQYIADQPADGQHIWVGTQAFTEINPSAFNNRAGRSTISAIHQRRAGAAGVRGTSERAGEELRGVPDLGQGNRGKLSYSSYTPGTPSHFLGYQLNEKFDLDLTHVPFRGSGLQATAWSPAIRSSASRRSTRRTDDHAGKLKDFAHHRSSATRSCRTCRRSPRLAIRNSPRGFGSGCW